MVSGMFAGAVGGAGVTFFIRAVDQYSKEISSAQGAFSKLGAIAGGALRTGLVAAASALTAIGTAGFTTGKQIEQSRIAFETMLGSAEKAQVLMRDIVKFAQKTPFELPGVVDATRQLIAMGAATDQDAIPVLKALGDVSAGVNGDIQRIALNFGQVATQGKLTGREIRDFAVQGIPLIEELATMFGVTEAEIQSMTSAGEIGFDDVRQAFMNMSGEGGKFFNLMEKQSLTFGGRLSNLKDILMTTAAELVGISTTGEIRQGSIFAIASQQVENLVSSIDRVKDSVRIAFAGARAFILDFWESIVNVKNQFVETFSSLRREGVTSQTVFEKLSKIWDGLKFAFEAVGLAINVIVRALEKVGIWDYFLNWWGQLADVIGWTWDKLKGLTIIAAELGNKLGLVTDEELESLKLTREQNAALEITVAMEAEREIILEEQSSTKAGILDVTKEQYDVESDITRNLKEQYNYWQAMRGGVKPGGLNAQFLDSLTDAERTMIQGGYTPTRVRLQQAQQFNDFMMRPGLPAVNFSPDDTIIGVKNPDKLMGGKSINVYIDSVQGLDSDAVAESLQRMLSRQITI